MLFHNSVQTYARPVAGAGVRQQLARRHGWEMPGGIQPWKAAGKFGLVLCAVVGVCLAGSGVYKGGLEKSVSAVESQRHDLMDTHISLLAKRATLLTPQHIELAAKETLSLRVPLPGHVNRYNAKKGYFEKL